METNLETGVETRVVAGEHDWLARYVASGLMIIGGLEWLLGRVVSRMAAAPTLEGIGRTLIEVFGGVGLFLISTAFILAASLYFLSVLQSGGYANKRFDKAGLALAIYLSLFGVFTVADALFVALRLFHDQAWLNITFNILSLVAVWWVTLSYAVRTRHDSPIQARMAALMVAVAYSGWYYAVLYSWVQGPGSAGAGGPADALAAGELVAVLTPIAFFAAIALPGRKWRNLRRWIAPIVLVALFSAGNIADIVFNQGFTGVFSIWSVGFTLYLPWPLYALSLGLYAYSVLTCFARHEGVERDLANANTGLGLLLLLFAGFYLQLTYQHLLAVLALLLFTGGARPFGVVTVRPQF